MTKPGFEEKRIALWRAVMEKEFAKSVGDDGLFPNYTDKDIWMAGFEAGYNHLAKTQKKSLVKPSNLDSEGTSFHDVTIQCTMRDLVKLLGDCTYGQNSGKDKVNCEWVCETSNGEVFTIYDYKYYRPLQEDEIVVWHIGANSRRVSNMAANQLIQSLNEL